MPRSQTVWSGHPEQEEGPDSEVCGLGRSRHSWSGHGVGPWTGALENRDPNPAGREPWLSQEEAQRRGGESVDPLAGLGLLWDLRLHLELQDLSGSMGRTSCPAEGAQSASGGRQGLGVSASLGRYEAESGAPAGMQGTTGAETEDTAGTASMAATGSRVESVRRGAAAAAAAAADVGLADSVPKAWAVLLLAVLAVLAEVWAAEAGRWVWLGGTESESAVGS